MGLREFFGLCNHKWEEKESRDIMNTKTKTRMGTRIKLQCKKCGDIKFIRDSIWDY